MLNQMRDNCDHISRASSLPSEESRDPNRQIISPKEATGISALRDIAHGLKTVLKTVQVSKSLLMKLNAMCPKVVRSEQVLSATTVTEASSVLQACEKLQPAPLLSGESAFSDFPSHQIETKQGSE